MRCAISSCGSSWASVAWRSAMGTDTAMSPARCGGTTLSTSPLTVSNSVRTDIDAGVSEGPFTRLAAHVGVVPVARAGFLELGHAHTDDERAVAQWMLLCRTK